MNYYDEYGVVADMLQNHLTEVALMVMTKMIYMTFDMTFDDFRLPMMK